MALDVVCPSCGEPFSLPDDADGKRFTCPVCGERIQVQNGRGITLGGVLSERSSTARPRVSGWWISAPAVFLALLFLPSLGYHAFSIFIAATQNVDWAGRAIDPPAAQQAARLGAIMGVLGIGLLWAVSDILVFLGAISIFQRRRLWLARVGAGVAMIPCLSPCLVLGMPFGIWAFAVLCQPWAIDEFR